jgi:hypothetical protein
VIKKEWAVRRFFRFAEFAVACCGPGSFVYTLHWFDKTIRAGKEAPDAIHTLLVTNHDGLYRYITAEQDAQYDRLIVITTGLMILFFAYCFREKRRQTSARLHNL